MQEHFIVKIPHIQFTQTMYLILVSLILSFIIIYPIMGIGSITSIFAFLILAIILYIIVSNMSQENKSSALPSTAYPVPPHLGLDGISLDSMVAGM
jgi:hypothetical protein